MKKVLKNKVDINNLNIIGDSTFRQDDTVELEFYFINNITSSYSVPVKIKDKLEFYFLKSNGKYIIQTNNITIKEDVVTLKLDTNATNLPGELRLEIKLIDDEGRVTTGEKIFCVKKSIINNDLEKDENTVTILGDLKSTITNAESKRKELLEVSSQLVENQSLSYEGNYITGNGTLTGRTKGICINGKTIQNLLPTFNSGKWRVPSNKGVTLINNGIDISVSNDTVNITLNKAELPCVKANTEYTVLAKISNNTMDKDFNICHSYAGIMLGSSGVVVKSGFNGMCIGKFKSVVTLDDPFDRYEINLQLITGTVRIENIMLLEGDYTNQNFLYFEGIKSVGELEGGKIILESRGENILSLEGIDEKTNIVSANYVDIINSNGVLTCIANRDKDAYTQTNSTVFLEKGKTYTFSGETDAPNGWGTGDGTVELYLLLNNKYDNICGPITNKKSFTCNKTGVYWVRVDVNSKFIAKIWDVQLEEGNNKTNYEKCTSNKKEILIPIEGLRSLPNGVSDKIYEKDGKIILEQNIEKIILDGNENWNIEGGTLTAEKWEFSTSISHSNRSSKRTTTTDGGVLVNNNFGGAIRISTADYTADKTRNMVYVIFNGSNHPAHGNSKEAFVTWLKNNKATLYYQLETPVIHVLDNKNINLGTYLGTTHIYSKNSIAPIINLKIASNIGSIISENSQEINRIWDYLEKLKNS